MLLKEMNIDAHCSPCMRLSVTLMVMRGQDDCYDGGEIDGDDDGDSDGDEMDDDYDDDDDVSDGVGDGDNDGDDDGDSDGDEEHGPGVVSFIRRSCPRLGHLCQNLATRVNLYSAKFSSAF